MNLSHNKASYFSALSCDPNIINEETNHGSDVLYCSFLNNTATKQQCIYLINVNNGKCTHEIKNSNIIENKATYTIYSRGNTDIISSCILNNGDPCFYTENSDSNITLYFCCFDSMEKSGSGFVTSHGSTTTFIHGLTFLETGSCYASFDVIDSLIPTQISGIESVPFRNYFPFIKNNYRIVL